MAEKVLEIMIRTLMKFSQNFPPPHTKSNSKNENKERAVWNVGQTLRGNVCVACACVCVCVCECARAGVWGWERGQPGNRLMFEVAIMKTCNPWPADYTKQILGN